MSRGNQGVVKSILQKMPHTRDDDTILYYEVLKWRKFDPLKETAYELLKRIHNRELPSESFVVRCRAHLQQKDASLRGKMWNKRHQLGDRIREELRKEK